MTPPPSILWRWQSQGAQSTESNWFVKRIVMAVTTLRQQKRKVLDWSTNARTAALG